MSSTASTGERLSRKPARVGGRGARGVVRLDPETKHREADGVVGVVPQQHERPRGQALTPVASADRVAELPRGEQQDLAERPLAVRRDRQQQPVCLPRPDEARLGVGAREGRGQRREERDLRVVEELDHRVQVALVPFPEHQARCRQDNGGVARKVDMRVRGVHRGSFAGC